MKTGRIKTKKLLVDIKTATDINLYITGNCFPPVFTETAAEVDGNQTKSRQNSKIHQYSLKTNIFKVIIDIRYQMKKLSRFIYTS